MLTCKNVPTQSMCSNNMFLASRRCWKIFGVPHFKHKAMQRKEEDGVTQLEPTRLASLPQAGSPISAAQPQCPGP
jgi:hypothetical protein